MVHVATVHFGTTAWIDIQLAYLRRNLSEPYLVWANLDRLPEGEASKFDHVVPAIGPLPGKLNLLATEICANASPDDIIIFLDGDAFPISDPMPMIREALGHHALIAVRRDENLGEKQPHPCFCAITVGTWQEIAGDWSIGHFWIDTNGQPRSDDGGNLMRLLEHHDLSWQPIVRTNRVNPHPLFFGIYGDTVYHHGAGFRIPITAIDLEQIGLGLGTDFEGGRLPSSLAEARYRFRRKRRAIANTKLCEEMLNKIRSNSTFFQELM